MTRKTFLPLLAAFLLLAAQARAGDRESRFPPLPNGTWLLEVTFPPGPDAPPPFPVRNSSFPAIA